LNPVYKKGSLLFLALALPFSRLSAADGHSIPNIIIDEEHDAFYQDPFRELLKIVKEAVPSAFEEIARQWGLNPAAGLRHPLTVQIKEDAGAMHLQRRPAYTQSEGIGNHFRQSLVIDIGSYIEHRDENIQRMVRHEMAHVILNDATAGGSFASIPRWFHEGTAQSVTSEGHDAVQKAFAYWRLSDGALSEAGLCDLEGPIDEFAHGPDNGYCYPEYYLAVRRLRQLGGPHTLDKIIKGLGEGKKMNDLILEVTGMNSEAFQSDVQRYAHDVFAGRKPVP
jgi:hypothetical protein